MRLLSALLFAATFLWTGCGGRSGLEPTSLPRPAVEEQQLSSAIDLHLHRLEQRRLNGAPANWLVLAVTNRGARPLIMPMVQARSVATDEVLFGGGSGFRMTGFQEGPEDIGVYQIEALESGQTGYLTVSLGVAPLEAMKVVIGLREDGGEELLEEALVVTPAG